MWRQAPKITFYIYKCDHKIIVAINVGKGRETLGQIFKSTKRNLKIEH